MREERMPKQIVANKSRWAPKKFSMGNIGISRPRLGANQSDSQLGLSILSALSIAGLHSAINPSVFTLLTFGSKPEAKKRAMTGLWIGLAASTVASAAILMVFKETMPAIIGEVTAIALFGTGVWAINQTPTETIPSIENQGTEPGP